MIITIGCFELSDDSDSSGEINTELAEYANKHVKISCLLRH